MATSRIKLTATARHSVWKNDPRAAARAGCELIYDETTWLYSVAAHMIRYRLLLHEAVQKVMQAPTCRRLPLLLHRHRQTLSVCAYDQCLHWAHHDYGGNPYCGMHVPRRNP